MIQDIHQSKKYGQYMAKIGWIVEKANGCQIFIRQFPVLGSLIKIQRPNPPIPLAKIAKIAKHYRAFKVAIEPQLTEQPKKKRAKETPRMVAPETSGDSSEVKELASEAFITREQLRSFGYKKSNSPYLPTKTIHIALTQPEEEILSQIKKKTRYCLRRAQKSKIIVKQSQDIEGFIRLKSRKFWPFGCFVRKEIKALWQIFYPKDAVLLLAYPYTSLKHHSNLISSSHPELGSGSKSRNASRTRIPKRVRNDVEKPLAGVLLLFHQETTHYWLAASTKKGKQLFAPTLLVWQALKLSKKKGCQVFDFEGVYDPRFHQATKNWLGFTRFKKGFGGKEIEYPGCFVKTRFSF